MSFDVIAAFAMLLTPLGGMAGLIYALLARRNRALEKQNNELTRYVLTTCADKSESLREVAAIIARNSTSGGLE